MKNAQWGEIVNAQPLRTRESRSNEKGLDDEFDNTYAASGFCSSGIVISYGNDTGEVLAQESFDDTGIHFIFSKSTCIQYSNFHDIIGIGSVVQIYWSRSFERVVRGSHIVVHIEKMHVYKCCTLIKENVFITFNSQSSAGVAIGVTERNTNVAFHPNCFPGAKYETLRAHYESRTEFQKASNDNNRGNTNRMVEVILASVPFKVEINGGIEKIHFIVIKKCREVPGYQGVAVVTKVVRNIFLEACFLQTSDVVFFDSNACHWNILEKVSVGSLIGVLASPTFPSSCFKWYGYDVTMQCADDSFKDSIGNYTFIEKNKVMATDPNSMSSAFKKISTIKNEHRLEGTGILRSKKRIVRLPRQSIHSQLKLQNTLLDAPLSLLAGYEETETRGRNSTEKSGHIFRYIDGPRCSFSKQADILVAVELHGLSKKLRDSPVPETSRETHVNINDLRVKLSLLIDAEGFALNQKSESQFSLPDRTWAPRERRFAGIFDDLQWSLLGTFSRESDDKDTEEMAEKKTSSGGWWYRRISPRSMPVDLVKEMNTHRNVFKDCTVTSSSN